MNKDKSVNNSDNKYGSQIDNTLLAAVGSNKQETTDMEWTPHNPASWSIDEMVQDLQGKSEEEFNLHFSQLKQAFIDDSAKVVNEYKEDWHKGGLDIKERLENSEAEPNILSKQLEELEICKQQVADNLGFNVVAEDKASSSKEDSISGNSSSSESINGEPSEVESTNTAQTPTEFVQELSETEPMDMFDIDI